MSRRVRLSRAACRWLFRAETTICTRAELMRWRARHALNLAFRWRDKAHCDAIRRWEATQTPDPMAEHRQTPAVDVAGWRRAGWL